MKRSYKSLGLFLLASVISTAALINQGKWDEQSQTIAREEESQKLDELEKTYYNYAIGGYEVETQQREELENLMATASWSHGVFPVENFQAYTSNFGYRQSPSGIKQFHPGLDMAAPLGSGVRAWWGGYIVGLSDNTACGVSVVIRSGNWTHIYCHLSGYVQNYQGETYLVDRAGGITLKLGQPVSTGMRIGRVGMTGRTTGPHLHWGLKYGERLVDPGLVLNQMY